MTQNGMHDYLRKNYANDFRSSADISLFDLHICIFQKSNVDVYFFFRKNSLHLRKDIRFSKIFQKVEIIMLR